MIINTYKKVSVQEASPAQPAAAGKPPAPPIYSYDQQSEYRINGYAEYARLIDGISSALFDRYGVEYQLYASSDPNVEYWDLLRSDILEGNPEVEHVAKIFDRLEERMIRYDDEGDQPEYGVHLSVLNNVFAYPRWGVALARVPFFRTNGVYHEDYVFAVGDAELRSFLGGIRARERQQNMNKVTVFTDISHGIERRAEPVTRSVTRDEVVLAADIKEEIYRSIDQFFESDRTFYRTYNIPYKRGILLYGHPGNGKTTLVKSIAGSIPGPAAYWQITEYTSSESVKSVFEAASRLAPMVLIIEDIDSMPQEVRSYFLNTLDGATSKEGIFLIGTTNYPEKIDPGLMNRAGRFDRAYEIALPDETLRLQYLKQRGLGNFVSEEAMSETVRLTEGFSLAQLGEVYVGAALQWHEHGQPHTEDIIRSMRGELDKTRRKEWLKDSAGGKVGFF